MLEFLSRYLQSPTRSPPDFCLPIPLPLPSPSYLLGWNSPPLLYSFGTESAAGT